MRARTVLPLLCSAAILTLNGCGNTVPELPGSVPVEANDFVYDGHNFGPNRNAVYKEGVIAGCETANGNYTKDHARFETSLDYHDGWEHGRLHCKGTPDRG
jgi:hypothetical protein